jgi:predicted nucleic acid-binding protein
VPAPCTRPRSTGCSTDYSKSSTASTTPAGHRDHRSVEQNQDLPVNDSWVAACCLPRNLPLITFNTKDYIDFAEHDGLTLLQ